MTTKTNKTSKICPIGKKLLFCAIIPYVPLGIFPNRVGSEAVINSQPNFLTNGLVTTDSKIIVMVV
jgi:hypothetical protein